MNGNIKRYDMVNILRLICAYLVVMVHLVAFGSVSSQAKTFTSDFICRIAVPFFFITSGYFFYSNVYKEGYFKKYILKLIKIYAAIVVVYLILFIPSSMYLIFVQKGVIYTIKALFINGISPSLWYFPGLIVSITFVYIFIKRNLIKPLIVVSIILFVVALMGDCYLALINNTPFINIVNVYDFIFDNTRNGITFGVPFITIGVLIKKYNLNEKIKKPSRLIIVFSVIYAVEAYIVFVVGITKSYNFCFSLILLVPIIFIAALNSKVTIANETSRYIREISLWIYAFHELIYIQLCNLGLFGQASSLLVYFFVCGVVTIIAYIIARIRLKKIALNKTAARKIVLYSGLILIISWALINTPIKNNTTTDSSQAIFTQTDFSFTKDKENTNITGPLWKVSDEDSSVYLYSCYTLLEDELAEDKTIYPLSSVFENALNDSDEIILYAAEHDGKSNAKMYFGAKYDTLNKHVTSEANDILMGKTKEVIEKVTEKVKEEAKETGIKDFYVYFNDCKGARAYYEICNFLEKNDMNIDEHQYSTDEYLKFKANKLNKKIQYMFANNEIILALCTNEDNNVNNAYTMLIKYINNDYLNNMQKSFDYWKHGDNDKAYELFNTYTFENAEDKANFEKYKKIVDEDYNNGFNPLKDKAVESISTYLKDNRKCFVSLDFKMFSGENNILDKLKAEGYIVEKIDN